MQREHGGCKVRALRFVHQICYICVLCLSMQCALCALCVPCAVCMLGMLWMLRAVCMLCVLCTLHALRALCMLCTQCKQNTWRSADAFFQDAVPLKANRIAPGPEAIRHLVSCFFSHSSSWVSKLYSSFAFSTVKMVRSAYKSCALFDIGSLKALLCKA